MAGNADYYDIAQAAMDDAEKQDTPKELSSKEKAAAILREAHESDDFGRLRNLVPAEAMDFDDPEVMQIMLENEEALSNEFVAMQNDYKQTGDEDLLNMYIEEAGAQFQQRPRPQAGSPAKPQQRVGVQWQQTQMNNARR